MEDTIEGEKKDNHTPGFLSPLKKTIPASLWRVNLSWNLILSSAIGLWWMLYPGNFEIVGSVANNFTTPGALVITFSVIAMAEVGRALRFINIAFAAWLTVAMFLFKNVFAQALSNTVISGVIVIVLSFPKGGIPEKYGTFDRVYSLEKEIAELINYNERNE